MPTKIILIRHGDTKWNRQKRYVGITDIDLNEKGRQQAQRLACRLRKENIDKIYVSGSKRTRHFARIALKGRPFKKLSGLHEMNFGALEGKTYEEAMKAFPEIYQEWIQNPLSATLPKGESLKKMAARVRKIFKQILLQDRGKTIAVFTHAGPIRVILCDVLRMDFKKMWQIKAGLGSLRVIEFTDGKSRGRLLKGVFNG